MLAAVGGGVVRLKCSVHAGHYWGACRHKAGAAVKSAFKSWNMVGYYPSLKDLLLKLMLVFLLIYAHAHVHDESWIIRNP